MTPHFRGDGGLVSGGSLQSPGLKSFPAQSRHYSPRANASHSTLEALMRAPECGAFMARPGDEARTDNT